MKKWEYRQVEMEIYGDRSETEEKVQVFLNKAGTLGWELVFYRDLTLGISFLFKRPIPQKKLKRSP